MKRILLSIAMVVSAVATFAQLPVGTWSVQPKVGLNVATITDFDGIDPRCGVVAGAELQYQISDIFALSFGALYSMQGCKGDDGGVDVTDKLDYINLPILANVYVTRGLAVKAGLQPGFNVSSKEKYKGDRESYEKDIDGVNTVELSIPIGVSYEFSDFVLDARYNFGVTKIADGISSKNSVFQFTVGYKFAL